MKESFKDISGKLTLISIAAFVLGSFILTQHLNLFQIQDYDLLKPHAIIVGFVYLLFLGTNVVFFSFKAGSDKDYSFNILRLIIGGIIKIPIISMTILFICMPEFIFHPEFKLHFWNYSFDVKIISFLLILNVFMLFGSSFVLSDENAEKYINKIKPILIILIFISTLLLFLTFSRHSFFKSILSIELFICLGVNFFIIGYRSAKLFDLKNASTNPPNPKWSDNSYFHFGNSDYGKFLQRLFLILAILFLLLKTTFDYTKVIFSNLSQSYGGGKLTKMAIIVGKDTLTGEKVYESSDYLFLAKRDSSIIKTDWKNINAILKRPE